MIVVRSAMTCGPECSRQEIRHIYSSDENVNVDE